MTQPNRVGKYFVADVRAIYEPEPAARLITFLAAMLTI
jgi:hypothetical protein